MRFFAIIIATIILLLVFYYFTWVIHMFFPIFGKRVSPEKAIIPFYGWYRLFHDPKF